jgi:hypothetical protein
MLGRLPHSIVATEKDGSCHNINPFDPSSPICRYRADILTISAEMRQSATKFGRR